MLQISLLSVPSKTEALPLPNFAGRVSPVLRNFGKVSVVHVTPVYFCDIHLSFIMQLTLAGIIF